jgi:hypothetical protein
LKSFPSQSTVEYLLDSVNNFENDVIGKGNVRVQVDAQTLEENVLRSLVLANLSVLAYGMTLERLIQEAQMVENEIEYWKVVSNDKWERWMFFLQSKLSLKC